MKKKTLGVVLGLAALTMLVAPMAVQAQTVTPFTIFPVNTGLGTLDLRQTVVNIIKWILGILALLAVALVIYGGFLWMTSAGDESRIDKGKSVISAAIVGLIIILLAWAIVVFVVGTTANVTR